MDGWTALRQRWWRAGALNILLPGTSLLRRCLLFSRPWHGLLLIVLPHDGITRLVTVILAVNRWLLVYAGIAVR
ncbi:MAG: hypothetical protein A2Z64_02680 [Betaproteobacteria bacterium RIFCSPLOWO2_02_67_12]|nr:MAG: hypothetical protein A2Z64_02680 [Betaproteobacteria bacterium RIFCSPLOWO2_02_67_12]OGA30937.1 MAG: hypothetical protein A3I65_08785 [Betaproteobacteria bacterium RIFCSPLOWO2_02_FULL_68_150]OGA70530.1 MAG: hypothetical protein A3F77_08235 [Betaproteobacteria bacterium RIFCSPLOWO2_12_FULL_67_28]